MSGKSSIDQELERLLAGEETGLSALYRKLPAVEPDQKLDAAVLAMAHRAVNPHLAATSRADRRAPARPKPWMFALGSAAGVVLAAGVAWQLRSTIQQNGDEALQRASAPAAEGVIAVTPKERATKSDTAPAPATPSAAQAPVLAAPPPPAPAAATASKPVATPPLGDDALRSKLELERLKKSADEKAKADSTEEEVLSANRDRREEHGVTEYTLPAGAAGPAPRPTPFPAEPAKQADTRADKAEDRAAAPGQQGEKLETITVTGSRVRRVDLETASPVVQMEQDSVERKAAIASGGSHAEAPAPAAQPKDATSAKALRGAPATASPSRSTVLQNNSRLDPEAWVGVMQQLLRDDRREEARENLDLFRRKYPDFKLPRDLKALLDSP